MYNILNYRIVTEISYCIYTLSQDTDGLKPTTFYIMCGKVLLEFKF